MTTTAAQRAAAKADVAALRAEGLKVVVHPGAYKRGRPGLYAPRGWMIHHDATAKGPSPGVLPILINGRWDLTGPLCQWWLDTDGTWHLIAAGRANHGGAGIGRFLGRDEANSRSTGLEIDHTVGEPWKAVQYDSLVRGTAVIARRRGWKDGNVVGHKEYQPGKIDPALSMDELRKDIVDDAAHFTLTRTLSLGDHGRDVERWRHKLGQVYGLRFTARTQTRTKARRKKEKLRVGAGSVGPVLARRSGLVFKRK